MTRLCPSCQRPTIRREGVCGRPECQVRPQPERVEHVKDDRPEAEIRLDIRRWYEAHGASVYDMEQNRPTRQTPGMSDLIVLVPHGVALRPGARFVEVKRWPNKQTEAQALCQIAVEVAGGTYLLAYSVDDVIAYETTEET